MLEDSDLEKRCGDLLKGRGPYDRVVREATTVLDDRLKELGGIKGYMKPVDVVEKVLIPISADDLARLEAEGVI